MQLTHYKAAMSPTLAELEMVSTEKKGKVHKEYIIWNKLRCVCLL